MSSSSLSGGALPVLPRNVVVHIATFVDIPDLATVARVCAAWRDVASDPLVCAALFGRFFGGAADHDAVVPTEGWHATLRRVVAEYRAVPERERLLWLLRRRFSAGVHRVLCRAQASGELGALLNPSTMRTTPLVAAVEVGSEDDVKVLLRFGADVSFASRHTLGRTALHAAAFHGQARIAEVLLAHGANAVAVEAQFGQTAMHVAASQGHVAVMRVLYAAHPELASRVDRDGWTPAHVAHRKGHREALELLNQWTAHMH
jgi:hypothetical protein